MFTILINIVYFHKEMCITFLQYVYETCAVYNCQCKIQCALNCPVIDAENSLLEFFFHMRENHWNLTAREEQQCIY